MANHAYVRDCKTQLTKEGIELAFDKINQDLTCGLLSYKHSKDEDGRDYWIIRLHELHNEYGVELSSEDCQYHGIEVWRNSDTEFEIRHGHQFQVMWWLDRQITAEIARAFNGHLFDDAFSEEITPTPKSSFYDYAMLRVAGIPDKNEATCRLNTLMVSAPKKLVKDWELPLDTKKELLAQYDLLIQHQSISLEN